MRIFCAVVFVSIFANAASPQTSEHMRFGRYTGPKSLGWYTHEHFVRLKPFLSAFGAQPNGSETYCFADMKNGLYLHAQIDDEHDRGRVQRMFLSSFPNCVHMPVAAAELPPEVWKTPEGIRIGSTKEEVLKSYGQPTWRQTGTFEVTSDEIAGVRTRRQSTPDLGDERFGYSCDLGEKEVCDSLEFFEVGFSKGRVVWLEISDSE